MTMGKKTNPNGSPLNLIKRADKEEGPPMISQRSFVALMVYGAGIGEANLSNMAEKKRGQGRSVRD